MKNGFGFLKPNILIINSAIAPLGLYLSEVKTYTCNKTCNKSVHNIFICNNSKLYTKQPATEWLKILWYIHAMEYYSAIKRNC
jgi:hypothetical protein